MKRPMGFLICVLSVGLLFFLPSCSDSPTNSPISPNTQATGQIDPDQPGGVLLGTVATSMSSAMVEVWAQNLTIESDEIVSFDAVIVNKCRCDIVAPIHFVITSITPDVVQVENADMDGPDGPVFDFSDDVGGDGVLGPLESSDPVKMKFRWPEAMAFAIGFRVDAGPPSSGSIAGVVFNDLNGDGARDSSEPGIGGVFVELRPSGREILYRARTDNSGRYIFRDLTADVYSASVLPFTNVRPTTPNPLVITLVELPDGTVSQFEGADFGFHWLGEPPPPGGPIFGWVDVGPGSSNGTLVEATFDVPLFFAAVEFFLLVVPPPIAGPIPLRIDKAEVAIDGQVAWDFVCHPPDTLVCSPSVKVPLGDLSIGNTPGTGTQHHIRILTEGDERSFLSYAIVAETILPNRQ